MVGAKSPGKGIEYPKNEKNDDPADGETMSSPETRDKVLLQWCRDRQKHSNAAVHKWHSDEDGDHPWR